jgi:hypothetical protein
MTQVLSSSVALVVGILVLAFNRRYAEYTIVSQNKSWALDYGAKQVLLVRIGSCIVGVAFVIVGAIGLLGWLRFR